MTRGADSGPGSLRDAFDVVSNLFVGTFVIDVIPANLEIRPVNVSGGLQFYYPYYSGDLTLNGNGLRLIGNSFINASCLYLGGGGGGGHSGGATLSVYDVSFENFNANGFGGVINALQSQVNLQR